MVFSPSLRPKRGRKKDLRETTPKSPEGNQGSLHLPVTIDNCIGPSPRVKPTGVPRGRSLLGRGMWGCPPTTSSAGEGGQGDEVSAQPNGHG